MTYDIIHPHNIENEWTEIAPWIALAVGGEATLFDITYIKDQAQAGGCVVWVGRNDDKGIEVVLVGQIAFYCGMKTLVLRWLAGHQMINWLEHLALVENWAGMNGFLRIEVWGRKGWEKELKHFGFSHEYTALGKFLPKRIH